MLSRKKLNKLNNMNSYYLLTKEKEKEKEK